MGSFRDRSLDSECTSENSLHYTPTIQTSATVHILLTSMYSCQVYQYYYISYESCDSSLGIVIGLQAGMWDQGSILGRGKIFVPSLQHSVALGPSQPPGCQEAPFLGVKFLLSESDWSLP